MIAFLHGSIVEKHPTRVLLDVGGVGYEVCIPLSSYDRLPHVGEKCRILTYDYIREDAHQLFGFMTDAERDVFVLLMGVTGIGPKIALGALSGLTVRELKAAIAGADVKRLSSVSGIGRKLAERMIVELKDKFSAGEALEALAGDQALPEDHTMRDAVLALTALGHRPDAAQKLVADVLRKAGGRKLSVEEVIKHSLGG